MTIHPVFEYEDEHGSRLEPRDLFILWLSTLVLHRVVEETTEKTISRFIMGARQPTSDPIPSTQTVALVSELGGNVEFREGYPVPTPGENEVLAKVLYTGVCQSGEFLYFPSLL